MEGCCALQAAITVSLTLATRQVNNGSYLQGLERLMPTEAKVVGMGGCGVDYLAQVACYPKPDAKLRTEQLEASMMLRIRQPPGVATQLVLKVLDERGWGAVERQACGTRGNSRSLKSRDLHWCPSSASLI